MIRIASVNVPDEKIAEIALTYIYGIGRPTAISLCQAVKIDPTKPLKDADEKNIVALREKIEQTVRVEGDLRREVQQNIKALKEINCYRGMRHKANLPVRGQHTKTNARTKRGKKVTMGSGKRKVTKT